MSFLRRPQKINRGRFSLTPRTMEQQKQAEVEKRQIKEQQIQKTRDVIKLLGLERETQRIETQTQLDAIKKNGCFTLPNGETQCRGKGGLFVSPKVFGERVDKFITEDAAIGLSVGLKAVALVGGGIVPIGILAAATGFQKAGAFSGAGFGLTSRRKRRRRRR